MAAIALAFGIETAILTFLLVEFGEENGGELQIPDNVNFFDLIDAANEIDVLGASIDTSSHGRDEVHKPKHLAKDVVDRIRKFRNLIHPAAALRLVPRTFTKSPVCGAVTTMPLPMYISTCWLPPGPRKTRSPGWSALRGMWGSVSYCAPE